MKKTKRSRTAVSYLSDAQLSIFVRRRVFQVCDPDIVPDDRIYISQKAWDELQSLVRKYTRKDNAENP